MNANSSDSSRSPSNSKDVALEKDQPRYSLSRILPLHKFWVAATLLGMAVAFAWWPVTLHAFRTDHTCLLLEVPHEQGFSETWSHLVSYNRTRKCQPSDGLLYRPVLFSLMAAEFSLLGRDPLPWQITGFVIWFLGAVAVLAFFRQFFDPRFAFLLGLYFAVQVSFVEVVSWQHIHGYILYTSLMLFIVGLYWKWHENLTPVRRAYLFLLGTIAAFSYELGGPTLGVIGFAHWFFHRGLQRWKIAEWMILPPLYGLVSYADFIMRGAKALAEPQRREWATQNFNIVWSHLMAWMALPTPIISPDEFRLRMQVGGWQGWLGALLLIASAIWIARRFWSVRGKSEFNKHKVIIAAGLVATFAFVCTIVLGRVATRSIHYFSVNTYYGYLYAAYMLPVLAAAYAIRPATGRVRQILLGLFGLLSIVSMIMAQNTTFEMSERMAHTRNFQRNVAEIIEVSPVLARDGIEFCHKPIGNQGFADLVGMQARPEEVIDWVRLIYGRTTFEKPHFVAHCHNGEIGVILPCEGCPGYQTCCSKFLAENPPTKKPNPRSDR